VAVFVSGLIAFSTLSGEHTRYTRVDLAFFGICSFSFLVSLHLNISRRGEKIWNDPRFLKVIVVEALWSLVFFAGMTAFYFLQEPADGLKFAVSLAVFFLMSCALALLSKKRVIATCREENTEVSVG
jgi:hypothetical protein